MTTKAKRKKVERVEIWAVMFHGDLRFTSIPQTKNVVAHLVESRPEDAAEVKALRRVAKAAEKTQWRIYCAFTASLPVPRRGCLCDPCKLGRALAALKAREGR